VIGEMAFLQFGPATDRGIVLFAPVEIGVRVNGLPAPGMRVLTHGDEILVEGKRYRFSDESVPEITTFREVTGVRAPNCPICRGPIKDGQEAVRCPRCGHWFHQASATAGSPAKACWTYAETCRICRHPTSLDGHSIWRPDMEDDDD
jgi:hypothetical protein